MVVSYQRMLPNLLIIGATKAGTTSLHHYLDQHPEIFMCKRKETNFFAKDSIYFKMNTWGGAIAQGHPIGASGAIRVVSLIHSLRATGGRYGLAVACHGGGGAVAVVIENLET